jgi:hypothetical protein
LTGAFVQVALGQEVCPSADVLGCDRYVDAHGDRLAGSKGVAETGAAA